jgi:hypothetical protein
LFSVVAGIGALALIWRPRLAEYTLPTRFWLDSQHFLLAAGVLVVGFAILLMEIKGRMKNHNPRRSWLSFLTVGELSSSLLVACAAGLLVFLKIPGLAPVTRYCHTIFDLAIALVVLGAIAGVMRRAGRMTFFPGAADRSLATASGHRPPDSCSGSEFRR